MIWLEPFYPEVERTFIAAIPPYWSSLQDVVRVVFRGELPSIVRLPLITCRAVNGDPARAIPVAAALIAAGVSSRIVDDLGDRDRPGQLWQLVGDARAWNYASALQLLPFHILSRSELPADLFRRINQLYIDTFFCLMVGQDRDLAKSTETIDDYWTTIALKTATPFAAACTAGALVGTDVVEWIEACHLYGHHIGMAIQIFNDMDSIWYPEGKTDIAQGKLTLPLIYALELDHPLRKELSAIIRAGELATQSARVKAILETVDAKAFLVWAAFKEIEQALAAIEILPDGEGKDSLIVFAKGMFADVSELIDENGAPRVPTEHE